MVKKVRKTAEGVKPSQDEIKEAPNAPEDVKEKGSNDDNKSSKSRRSSQKKKDSVGSENGADKSTELKSTPPTTPPEPAPEKIHAEPDWDTAAVIREPYISVRVFI